MRNNAKHPLFIFRDIYWDGWERSYCRYSLIRNKHNVSRRYHACDIDLDDPVCLLRHSLPNCRKHNASHQHQNAHGTR